METNTRTESKFLVPLAIVVAGALIAGAIYMGGGSGSNLDGGSRKTDIDVAGVSADDHIRGSSDAPVVIVEYSDLECPFCKVFHNTMKEIVSTYQGQVAWVYRHFPIPQLHQKAIQEAIATECAAEQGGNAAFWSYIDKVFETTNSNDSLDLALLPQIAGDLGLDVAAFNECLSSGKFNDKIQESMEAAAKTGARGTPYSIMLLDKALTNTQVASIEKILTSRGLNASAVIISDNKKEVAIGGALPLELMQEILDAIL